MRASVILSAIAAIAWPSAASAQDHHRPPPKFPDSVDELSAPRLPQPFVLPDLSHPSWDLALGWLVGVAAAARTDRASPALGLARASVEGDVFFPRSLYVGGTVPFASALAPDGASGTKTVLGNVEGHVRVVFPLPSVLAFGAELGVVAPTASFDKDSGAHAAALEAASLEPTDGVHFAPEAVALRPAMDVRVLRGPFVVQARQGIDIVIDSASGRTVTTGRLLGHGGIRVKRDVELSIEATQSYLFDERVPDGRRTAMTIGPGARLSLGTIDVGAAVLTSLFGPLSPDIDRFVAARLSLVTHLE